MAADRAQILFAPDVWVRVMDQPDCVRVGLHNDQPCAVVKINQPSAEFLAQHETWVCCKKSQRENEAPLTRLWLTLQQETHRAITQDFPSAVLDDLVLFDYDMAKRGLRMISRNVLDWRMPSWGPIDPANFSQVTQRYEEHKNLQKQLAEQYNEVQRLRRVVEEEAKKLLPLQAATI